MCCSAAQTGSSSSSMAASLLLLAGAPVGGEVTAQVLPAPVVALVQSPTGFQAPFGHSHAEGRLEHEGLDVGEREEL